MSDLMLHHDTIIWEVRSRPLVWRSNLRVINVRAALCGLGVAATERQLMLVVAGAKVNRFAVGAASVC